MRKKVRKVFWIGFSGGLILLILIYVMMSHTNLPAKGFTQLMNRTIAQKLRFEVSVGEVKGDLFNGLNLSDIALYSLENQRKKRVVHIAEMRLRYHLKDILGRRPLFSEIQLIEPNFNIDASIQQHFSSGSQRETGQNDSAGSDPLFKVEHLEMHEGIFSYSATTGGSITLYNMYLKGGVQYQGKTVSARLESGRFYWIEKDVHVDEMELDAALVGDTLTADRFLIATTQSFVQGGGRIDGFHPPKLNVQLRQSNVSLDEVSRILGLQQGDLTGSVVIDATFSGEPSTLRIQTEGQGTLQNYSFDRFGVDVIFAGKELDFSHFELHSGGTCVSGSASVSLGVLKKYRGDVAFEHLNVSAIEHLDVDSDLNGSIFVTGQGFSQETFGLSADLHLLESTLDGFHFDRCVGRCSVSIEMVSTEGPLTLHLGETSVAIAGGVTFDGMIEAQGEISVVNLEELTRMFQLPVHKGQAKATVQLSGILSDPDVRGELSIDSLTNAAYSAERCFGRIHLRNVIKGFHGSADLRGRNGHVGRIPVSTFETLLSFSGSTVHIDSLTAANNETDITAKGTFQTADGIQRLNMTQTVVRFRNYTITNADTARLSLGHDGSILGRGRYTVGEGDFDISLSVDSEGSIEGELALRSVDLFPIVETFRIAKDIHGIADGRLTMRGNLKDPQSDVALTVRRGLFASIPFDSLMCDVHYDEEKLEIEALNLFDRDRNVLRCHGFLSLRLSFSGEQFFSVLPDEEVSVSLHFEDFDLQPFSSLTLLPKPLSGLCSGAMDLGRCLREPTMGLDVLIRDARYDILQFGDVRAKFQYDAGLLKVLFLEASHEGTEYASTGVIPLNLSWPFNETLFPREDMDFNFGMAGKIPFSLIPLLTRRVENLSGDIDLRFSVHGHFRKPVLNGHLSLEKGRLQLSYLENPITDLEVALTVADTLLSLHRCVGRMGEGDIEKRGVFDSLLRLFTFRKRGDGGQVSLRGTLNFANLDQIRYDLICEGNAIFLRPLRKGIDVLVDADVRLAGVKYPHLSGDIVVTQGLVREAFKSRDQVEPEPQTSEAQKMGPSLDLNIRIPGNFQIEGSDYIQELTLELKGDLQIVKARTGPEFQFFGNAETIRGKYRIYGNLFRITQGTVSFSGISEINPLLNIEAETRVGREPIYLNLTGTLLQPEVKLWSQSGYSEKDIITLLTLGATTAAVDTVGVSDAFESKATNVLGSLIEGELARRARRGLGVDTFEITSGSTSQLTPDETEVTVGKYLSDRVYLEYSRRLAAESEQEVELEYRLNRHLSFLGTRDRRGLYHLQLQLKVDY
ncbi:MAG: translocation/assembly module TamB [Gemmatimonadota bacterium]|nr:MAG: translocation/assembly module TamB [Gemmatimonadota bacterium]